MLVFSRQQKVVLGVYNKLTPHRFSSEQHQIGKQNIPLTQEGEAVYHIAYFSEPDTVAEHVELLQDNLLPPEQGPVL